MQVQHIIINLEVYIFVKSVSKVQWLKMKSTHKTKVYKKNLLGAITFTYNLTETVKSIYFVIRYLIRFNNILYYYIFITFHI